MIRGAIFDMDGTLLDSNRLWDFVPIRYLARQGITAESGISKKIFTMTLPEAIDYLIRTYGLKKSPEEVKTGIDELCLEMYEQDAPVKPGVLTLLEGLRDRGVPMAVATVTDRPMVEAALKKHGILEMFAGIVTAADVGAGKHEPLIFLKAAEMISCRPDETLVFEDGLHAIRTAKNAGFPTVGVFDEESANAQEEIKSTSTYYLKDFSRCDEFLKEIFG